MKTIVGTVIVALTASAAMAITGVPGNVQLFGEQTILAPLVPQFRRCGAKKIIFKANGRYSNLYVNQNPKDTAIFGCVRRVARNVRWQVQLNIGKYGRYEI